MCAEMGSNMLQKELIDKLHKNSILSADEFYKMLSEHDEEDSEYLFGLARKVRENIYGKDVYIRGLIEFSNYCRNDCYYCGIRKSMHLCYRKEHLGSPAMKGLLKRPWNR